MRKEAVVLRNDHWRLGVLPGTGASLAYGKIRMPDGAWRNLLRPTPASRAGDPASCASYVLVPFSNRVRDGVLRFDGRTFQLRRHVGDRNAMHGTGLEFAWDVVAASDRAVTLALETSDLVGANFPWSFRAEVSYALEGSRLTIGTRLTNTDSARFPAGFGHHPFFMRGIREPRTSEVRVQIPASGAYPMLDAIPVGPALPPPEALDYRAMRALDGALLNDCYTRSGTDPVRLEWPESGVRVAIGSDEVFAHTLLYAPPRRPFFAVEPVTNANDGFNLMADGVAGHGVFVLEPGQARSGDIRIDVEVA